MTTAAIRKRELEAMELAEKYREENRALKQVIEVQADRILALTALMPRVDVPSAWQDSCDINSSSTTITTASDGGTIYYPALAAGSVTAHHGACLCPRCAVQIT